MSDAITRIAQNLATLAQSCSMTTAHFAQAIEGLNARITELEAQVAGLSVGIDVQGTQHGCVCPVGAEATCRGWGCPRVQQSVQIMTAPIWPTTPQSHE